MAGQPRSTDVGQRKLKLVLLLASIAFSAAAFLTLDWLRTAAIVRHSKASAKASTCRVPDPVLHHALKPNCVFIEHWGRDSFDYSTNSLGLRDEKIREVTLADARPRILILGSSMTEGMIAWRDNYVGRIAAHFPQYDFLNGGLAGYAPSNHLNVARMVLAKGVEVDEVMVFIDDSAVQWEVGFYRDVDASGAVTGPERQDEFPLSRYRKWRSLISTHLMLSNDILEHFDELLALVGCYRLTTGSRGNVFDMEVSAWTYRKANEADRIPLGYAPLGVEGGIAKAEAKMTLLWQELRKRNIPISVVVYPVPPELVHGTVDSRQVRIWREWCEGKCKRFISLFPAFFAAKAQCPPLQPGCWYLEHFIVGDHHFNAAGNALVADTVIKSLEEDPPARRPGTNRRSASGEVSGAH